MENKFINRYHSFCHSLANLKKSTVADPQADFVLEYAGMENRSAKDLLRDAVFMTEGLRR